MHKYLILCLICASLFVKIGHVMKFNDERKEMNMREKLVLAYSGGLDTSVSIKWLSDAGYDVGA